MCQSGLTETGWTVEKYVIQGLPPALSRIDGDAQIVLNLALSDKVIKPPRAKAGIKGCVLSTWFTRYNALYSSTPVAPSS